jgi:hypothetical protein
VTTPKGGAPPEKKAAAPAGTGTAEQIKGNYMQSDNNTNGRSPLLQRAVAVMTDGELHEFLPEQPPWCRRIGAEVFSAIVSGYDISPRQRQQLEFVYSLAMAIRDGEEIGPTYPAPTHRSVTEARAALSDEFEKILTATLEYNTSVAKLAA